MNIDELYSLEFADGGDYRIEVKDFGPIEHADVEFRPLTVFVGPSNTGKSYLATLTYALHRYFAAEAHPNAWSLGRLARTLGADVMDHGPREASALQLPTELASWTSTITADDNLPPLPPPVAEAVRGEVERGNRLTGPLREELGWSFGSDDIDELIRRSGSGAAEVVVVPSKPVDMGLLSYRIRVVGDQLDVEGSALESTDPLAGIGSSPVAKRWTHLLRREALWYQELESRGRIDDRSRTRHLKRIVHQLTEAARHPVVGPLKRLAHYLPAGRAGIMHSHKMVVAALVHSAARAGTRQTPNVPTLSGVVADFVAKLIGMGDRNGPRRGRRMRGKAASQLEEAVLGGTVRVESSESNYPQFLYRPRGWSSDLAMMRSSSMVSELAPLVLYLRHVVERGDVLIIDEPESHLHPGIQVEVIRQLADVVRAGVRVILTTHSEWVLEELSNLVLASQLPERKRRELGRPTGALPIDEVGVWLFKTDEASGGSVVSEIKLEETSLYSSSFDEAAASTYNDWATIADLLEGAR